MFFRLDMDRTVEFQTFLGDKARKSGPTDNHESEASSHARSSFNTEAARIGQEIHIVQLKLDELGKRMCITIFYIPETPI